MNNRSEILECQPRPMTEEQFADIELKLRSLRTEDLADEDEFIVVDFETKYDGLMFIQAISEESFKTCHIEIGLERKVKKFPKLLGKNEVPIDKTVEIFKQICDSIALPDLADWQDITEETMLMQGIEDK